MKEVSFCICGGGRIADNELNHFADKVKPIEVDGQYGYPVHCVPSKVALSKKIGQTVYDITADFDIEGKQSLLQQFKQLILA